MPKFIVKSMQNLTAVDTFDEVTFSGSTQRELESFQFDSEEEAMQFYEQRRSMLRVAGLGGQYYTYPERCDDD